MTEEDDPQPLTHSAATCHPEPVEGPAPAQPGAHGNHQPATSDQRPGSRRAYLRVVDAEEGEVVEDIGAVVDVVLE